MQKNIGTKTYVGLHRVMGPCVSRFNMLKDKWPTGVARRGHLNVYGLPGAEATAVRWPSPTIILLFLRRPLTSQMTASDLSVSLSLLSLSFSLFLPLSVFLPWLSTRQICWKPFHFAALERPLTGVMSTWRLSSLQLESCFCFV